MQTAPQTWGQTRGQIEITMNISPSSRRAEGCRLWNATGKCSRGFSLLVVALACAYLRRASQLLGSQSLVSAPSSATPVIDVFTAHALLLPAPCTVSFQANPTHAVLKLKKALFDPL